MTDRPILFSAPMVRAILDGRKTQTRRAVKPQPYIDHMGNACWNGFNFGQSLDRVPHFKSLASPLPSSRTGRVCCPYGAPGDRLWVREEHYCLGHWEPVEGVKTKTGLQKWKFVAAMAGGKVLFNPPVDAPSIVHRVRRDKNNPSQIQWYKRLARFMPRSASRITLEITNVRVDRLQDISNADAMSEGIEEYIGRKYTGEKPPADGRIRFSELWTEINGPDSWAANPFVCVIEFKRVTP